MPYRLTMTKRTDNIMENMYRIAVFLDYQPKTPENFWVLPSLILKRKINAINLFSYLESVVLELFSDLRPF